MARNALIPSMQLYDAPQGPNVGNLINPLMAGFQRGDKLRQEGFQNERALTAEARQGEQLQLQRNADNRASERVRIERLGKMAEVVDGITEPTQRAAAWQRLRQGFPGFDESFSKYSDPNDHVNGPKYLMAEVGSYMSPAQKEMESAKLAQINAQTKNIGADSYTAGDGFVLNKRTGEVQPMPAGVGGGVKTSLQPIWGQDANGNAVLMQPNSRGEAVATKLPDGVTPNKGVIKLDAGDHFVILDAVTRQPISRVQKNIAEQEAQKEVGQAAGKAQVALPQIENAANLALETIEKIKRHPGKQYGVGVAGVLPGVPGTQQRGFVALVNQAKGQVFLDAYNALRGGGAITEVEGAKAEAARARMDRAQTQEDFDAALEDYGDVVRRGLATARSSAKLRGSNVKRATPADPGTGAPQPKGLAPGNYVYDPASGQLRPAR